MKDSREFVIQTLSSKSPNRNIYLIIYPHEGKILVDSKALPASVFLCAACEGISVLVADVGQKRKKMRYFLPIDWVIHEWGGPPDLVDAIKKRNQALIYDMDRMKAMISEEA
jgi:hypothetical protein